MKVIIPVAGVGTRLRPHTHTIPKVLINIAGKPIISHIVDKLKDRENIEFVFIIGYMGEKIKDFLVERYKDTKFHFIEQEDRLGLGHAVYLAKEHLNDEDDALIVLGDTVFDTDYSFLDSNGSVLAVKRVDDPQRFGIAVIENEKIVKLIEKPTEFVSNLALVGIYYIKRWGELLRSLEYIITKNIRTKNEFQLTDALQNMIENKQIFFPHEIMGWFDCGKPETIIETNRHLLEQNSVFHSGHNSVIIPPCFIPDSAKIMDSIIGPYVSVGDNVIIRSSIIKNSIVDRNSEINNLNIDNSLIGANAIITGNSRQMNIGDSSEINF